MLAKSKINHLILLHIQEQDTFMNKTIFYLYLQKARNEREHVRYEGGGSISGS